MIKFYLLISGIVLACGTPNNQTEDSLEQVALGAVASSESTNEGQVISAFKDELADTIEGSPAASENNKEKVVFNTRGPKMEFVKPKEAVGENANLVRDDTTQKTDILKTSSKSNNVAVVDKQAAPNSASSKVKSDLSTNKGPDHSDWSKMLAQYVSEDGKVDYENWKKDHARLKRYLGVLALSVPEASWTRENAMAYWINVYNAFTIDLIVTNFPIKSILDLDNGKTWDVKRITLGNQNYSLNQIEHEILRPQFNDPRIHFAVNCAAISCPKLKNSAWQAVTLEDDLQKATYDFINNERFNKVAKSKLVLSKIFDWYKEDFGELVSFIDSFVSINVDKRANVEYMDYDWSLNKG